MIAVLLPLAAIAGWAIVATLRAAATDGYRRLPSH